MDKTYVGQNASAVESSPKFEPYSKVVLWVDEETAYVAGDDSGRTLEANLPWATQQLASSVLASIKGFSYQPITGTDALLDPAAEMGDGITLGGAYSALVSSNIIFDALFTADVSAPHDEELDHEYRYVSPERRELGRKVSLNRAYYGARITHANGLEIIKTARDGTEMSRAVLNSDIQAFYNDDGQEALYFDINAGKFRFRGDVEITGGTINVNNNFIVDADGNLTINGNINLSNGNITWGGNEPSSGISASEAKTIIDSTLVSSPNIKGGAFYDLDSVVKMELTRSEIMPSFQLSRTSTGQTLFRVWSSASVTDDNDGVNINFGNEVVWMCDFNQIFINTNTDGSITPAILVYGSHQFMDEVVFGYDNHPCNVTFGPGAIVKGLSVVFG